jgi:hypothetical protein
MCNNPHWQRSDREQDIEQGNAVASNEVRTTLLFQSVLFLYMASYGTGDLNLGILYEKRDQQNNDLDDLQAAITVVW